MIDTATRQDDEFRLGRDAKVSGTTINTIIEKTRAAVSEYEMLAETYVMSKVSIRLISGQMSP